MTPSDVVEAYAKAYDVILPGLGNVLRDCFRELSDELMRQLTLRSGAEHELDYYGSVL